MTSNISGWRNENYAPQRRIVQAILGHPSAPLCFRRLVIAILQGVVPGQTLSQGRNANRSDAFHQEFLSDDVFQVASAAIGHFTEKGPA